MNNLLQEYYKYDISSSGYIDRKYHINESHIYIRGVTQSGKTHLIKNYLSKFKKSSYLYIDCSDIRIKIDLFNQLLDDFCVDNKIEIIALDNYNNDIILPRVNQIILASEKPNDTNFQTLTLKPLDYEEFLVFESRYDDSSFSNFIQLGGFIHMHKLHPSMRIKYMQQSLTTKLSPIKIAILEIISHNLTTKLSAFNIYEKIKQSDKISKDKLYLHFYELIDDGYIHTLEKFDQPHATKNIYLCDIFIQYSLTTYRNFSRIFENIAFLELYKKEIEFYYLDGFNFYIPEQSSAIITSAFINEREIYKKIQNLESTIVKYQIKNIVVLTMNNESFLSHPLAQIELISLQRWALSLN